ncbi:guanine nucleotide binding protein, alpha subunit [Coprinopsis sp. MPI-PUGE-AT-0042]|nr:guanine nucleotide binding protein, alpha subunit [Coprinopsis sp. MPI-PUGE-AT-0042]
MHTKAVKSLSQKGLVTWGTEGVWVTTNLLGDCLRTKTLSLCRRTLGFGKVTFFLSYCFGVFLVTANGSRSPSHRDDDDPLALAIAPPPNETPEERRVREAQEAEAQRISDEIDERLKKEREERRRRRGLGKTATLKSIFPAHICPERMGRGTNAWRSVIFLNLVRNVNVILEHLDNLPITRHLVPLEFTEVHTRLLTRLEGVAMLQRDLEAGSDLPAWRCTRQNKRRGTVCRLEGNGKRRNGEFGIHSNNGWKSALNKFKTMRSPTQTDSENSSSSPTSPSRLNRDWEDEIAEQLESFREDIKALWEDSIVTEVLQRRKVRLENQPGYFILDADRIASRFYRPTDDDVIRARLRTLGVQEYRYIFDHGRTVGQEWRLYDVGGTRSSRAAWYPFFEDVDAIIFLAYVPFCFLVSPFDEKLAEDKRVNRLEDSYLLWRSVCSCKLLQRTQLILFLNKCDLLQAKLSRGVRIRDSVPSYGDRKNDHTTATRYFQQHFKEIARQHSPVQRPFYVHLTSVIDTRSTAVTLGAVEESILREHLRRADLM